MIKQKYILLLLNCKNIVINVNFKLKIGYNQLMKILNGFML